MNILLVGAHPDDIEFGMGATAIALKNKGANLSVLVLTDGDAGTYGSKEIRINEMKKACEFINAKLYRLEIKDCHVQYDIATIKKVASIIRVVKPKIIFSPHHSIIGDHREGRAHPDHEATGKIVRAAARYARFRNLDGITGEPYNPERIIYYMLSDYMKPDFVVDVSEYISDYKEYIKNYLSQLKLANGKLSELLIEHRKRHGLKHGVEFAEVFATERTILLAPDQLIKI